MVFSLGLKQAHAPVWGAFWSEKQDEAKLSDEGEPAGEQVEGSGWGL